MQTSAGAAVQSSMNEGRGDGYPAPPGDEYTVPHRDADDPSSTQKKKKQKIGTEDWDSEDDAVLASLLQKIIRTEPES